MRMEFPDRLERAQLSRAHESRRRLSDAMYWRIRTDGGKPVMYGTFDIHTGLVINRHYYVGPAAVPQHHRTAALELLERFARLFRRIRSSHTKENNTCLTLTI